MIDVWKLFNEEFKDDDHVVIIHDDTTSGAGVMCCGKLTIKNKCCMVGGKSFDWDDIIFIAHDGFPCRTFKIGMSNDELNNIENQEIVFLMRKLITKKPKEKIITKIVEIASEPYTHRYSFGGGCPFVFEDIQMQIINPFNSTMDFEETLLMKSKDGAVGMFWDIENEIFDFAAVA